MKKVFSIFAVLIVSIISLWFFFPWDDKEVNDSDLTLPVMQPIDAEENLHEALVEKQTVMEESVLKRFYAYEYRDTPPRQSDVFAIRPFARYMTTVIFEHDRFECGINEVPVCELNLIRGIGVMLITYAQAEAVNGDLVLAESAYEAAIKLAVSVTEQTSPVTTTELLTALAIIDKAEEVANSGAFSDLFLQEVKSAYSLNKEALAVAYKSEYHIFKEALRQAQPAQGFRSTYWWQPNKTLNSVAELWQQHVALATAGCGQVNAAKVAELEQFVVEHSNSKLVSFGNVISPNFKGKMAISVVVASLTGLHSNYCDAVAFLKE